MTARRSRVSVALLIKCLFFGISFMPIPGEAAANKGDKFILTVSEKPNLSKRTSHDARTKQRVLLRRAIENVLDDGHGEVRTTDKDRAAAGRELGSRSYDIKYSKSSKSSKGGKGKGHYGKGGKGKGGKGKGKGRRSSKGSKGSKSGKGKGNKSKNKSRNSSSSNSKKSSSSSSSTSTSKKKKESSGSRSKKSSKSKSKSRSKSRTSDSSGSDSSSSSGKGKGGRNKRSNSGSRSYKVASMTDGSTKSKMSDGDTNDKGGNKPWEQWNNGTGETNDKGGNKPWEQWNNGTGETNDNNGTGGGRTGGSGDASITESKTTTGLSADNADGEKQSGVGSDGSDGASGKSKADNADGEKQSGVGSDGSDGASGKSKGDAAATGESDGFVLFCDDYSSTSDYGKMRVEYEYMFTGDKGELYGIEEDMTHYVADNMLSQCNEKDRVYSKLRRERSRRLASGGVYGFDSAPKDNIVGDCKLSKDCRLVDGALTVYIADGAKRNKIRCDIVELIQTFSKENSDVTFMASDSCKKTSGSSASSRSASSAGTTAGIAIGIGAVLFGLLAILSFKRAESRNGKLFESCDDASETYSIPSTLNDSLTRGHDGSGEENHLFLSLRQIDDSSPNREDPYLSPSNGPYDESVRDIITATEFFVPDEESTDENKDCLEQSNCINPDCSDEMKENAIAAIECCDDACGVEDTKESLAALAYSATDAVATAEEWSTENVTALGRYIDEDMSAMSPYLYVIEEGEEEEEFLPPPPRNGTKRDP